MQETETVFGVDIASDEIEWFLPSNTEIAALKATACDNDANNNDEVLLGTYWTSTSGSGTTAYYYTVASDGTQTSGSISRVATNKYKIRAARMKP